MEAVLEDDVVEESRVARLESDVAHIQRDIADMKVDIREGRKEQGSLKAEIASLRDEMHVGFGNVQRELLSTRIWMFSLVGALLAVMAHGFKWI
ncbi:MAG TPA: hypothetical protein VNO35_18915 [Steroidobacteraceae bacterium]|nr:hypothetical protein [Steroidobacteraceae bacterium]